MGTSMFLALVAIALGVSHGYMLDPASPAGWGFSVVLSDIPYSPFSVFPYVNSAGRSKIMFSDAPSPPWYYTIDDSDWQTTLGPHVDESPPNSFQFQFAAVGGTLFQAGSFLNMMDGNANILKSFVLNADADTTFVCGGIVVNPFNRHLYVSCFVPVPIILDIDPSIFDGAEDGDVFILADGDFDVLLAPENTECYGPFGFMFTLAFSEDLQTLYSVCQGQDIASHINGFAIDPKEGTILDLIFQSPELPSAISVVAGTGCLKEYLYFTGLDGLFQMDLHGVVTPIVTGNLMFLMQQDPLDGSLLIPVLTDDESDPELGDIIRVVGPNCGGFVASRRYFAPGVPVGTACSEAAECSTDSCIEDACALSTYLGHCQTDVDCNDPEAEIPNGFWCLLWRKPEPEQHHHHHRRGRRHGPSFGDLPGPATAHTDAPRKLVFGTDGRHSSFGRDAAGSATTTTAAKVSIGMTTMMTSEDNVPQFQAVRRRWQHEHGGEGEGNWNRNRWRERLRQRYLEVEEPTSAEDFFPSRFGVCILNSCSIAAVCDTNAACIPVGDGTHICKCNPGYYGNGLPGHCVNPCDTMNGGCVTGATCSSTSLTETSCACPSNMAGDARTSCFLNPCIGADPGCATDSDDSLAFCNPSDADTFTCSCGAGYWTTDEGFCLVNACTTANYCDDHAACTPSGTMDGVATCTCHDGYKNTNMPPPSPTCVAATCIPLSLGAFPLNQIEHAIIGTCVGLVTGQTCQVGCGPGFKPRGSTFTTCTPTPNRPTSYYSVPQFECIPADQKDTSSKHGHHKHNDAPATPPPPVSAPQAWVCLTGQQCHPAAPSQILPKHSTSVKLHWTPLQNSPNGDVVSALVISILPSGGALTTYSSQITNPAFTNSITITGLTAGQTYTFRLVVTFTGSNAMVAGEPLVVTL